MAKFLGTPFIQEFDSNGDPLNGGKLYVYDVGTTNAKNSYPTIADAIAGTNANANPVILDSRGEAAVVLAGPSKLLLTDSADSTIWTKDNVNLDSDLTDANGNQLLEFTTTASATNHIGIVNAATGNSPIVRAEGEADTGVTIDNSEGEEIVILDSVASSVNEFTLKSAATGNNPILQATGDNSNVGIDFQAKGTGVYNFLATADAQGEIRLFEDTDNGTNYLGFKPPAALTASTTFTFPDGDGTANQALVTNASAVLSWATVPTQAAQSAIEAEANEDTYVPPDLVKHNPGVAKAWVLYNQQTVGIAASHNVTSVDDDAAGDFGVNFTTAFSSVGFTTAGTATGAATNENAQYILTVTSRAVGAVELHTTLNGDTSDQNVLADLDGVSVICFGDQA